MHKAAILLTVLAIAFGFVGTACEDDEPTEEEASANLCADLSELRDAVVGLQDISLSTTVEDLRETRDEIGQALDDVKDSAVEVGETRVDGIEQAYDDLSETIGGPSDDLTLREAAEAILDDLTTLATAAGDLFSSLDC